MDSGLKHWKALMLTGVGKYIEKDIKGSQTSNHESVNLKCKVGEIPLYFKLSGDSVFAGFQGVPVPLIQGGIKREKLIEEFISCLDRIGNDKKDSYLKILQFYCDAYKLFNDNIIKSSIMADIDKIASILYGYGMKRDIIKIIDSVWHDV